MKLEIEITEDELRSAIKRKVRTAVADQTNSYGQILQIPGGILTGYIEKK